MALEGHESDPDSSTEDTQLVVGFEEFFELALLDEMLTYSGNRHEPRWAVPAPSAHPLDERSLFDVVLLDDNGWQDLHLSIIEGVKHNRAPWNRCVSLLRGRAAACVIEFHYVCLDLRGEVAAFNAQLDAPSEGAAIRLHFFGEDVTKENVSSLTPEQRESYLGYVVCRQPGSPIVGRSVIQAPKYIQNSASIQEYVNFFGQTISVTGTPFMQQDERYAVCAHAATWVALYSAHRKGILERKLISDVVSVSNRTRSMHPSAPMALTPEQVQETIQFLGMHFPLQQIVNEDGRLSTLPVSPDDLGIDSETMERLAKIGSDLSETNAIQRQFDNTPAANDDIVGFLSALLESIGVEDTEAENTLTIEGRDAGTASEDVRLALKLIDKAVFKELRHYINSGFPIYCHTIDHAMILVGYDIDPDGKGYTFYFHDDQFGPYLRSEVLATASKAGFRRQSYADREDAFSTLFDPPDKDRADPAWYVRPADRDEPNRAVVTVGVASPPRLLLSADHALQNARRLIEDVKRDWDDRVEQDAPNDDSQAPEVTDLTRVSIIMGIDYKRQRLDHSDADSTQQRTLFSSIHLAEWVIVIEMVSTDLQTVLAEFVYDGTSSNDHPLVQLFRFRSSVLYRAPVSFPDVAMYDVGEFNPPPIHPPSSIGKTVGAR